MANIGDTARRLAKRRTDRRGMSRNFHGRHHIPNVKRYECSYCGSLIPAGEFQGHTPRCARENGVEEEVADGVNFLTREQEG